MEEGTQAPHSSGAGGASGAGGEPASYPNGQVNPTPAALCDEQEPRGKRLRRVGAVGGWVVAAMAMAALIGTVRHTFSFMTWLLLDVCMLHSRTGNALLLSCPQQSWVSHAFTRA